MKKIGLLTLYLCHGCCVGKATENNLAQEEFLFFFSLPFVFVVVVVFFTYNPSFFDIPSLGFDERSARETLWSEK